MKVVLTIPDGQLARVTTAFSIQIPGKTQDQTDLEHLQKVLIEYIQRVVQSHEEQAAIALARKTVVDDIKLRVDIKSATN